MGGGKKGSDLNDGYQLGIGGKLGAGIEVVGMGE